MGWNDTIASHINDIIKSETGKELSELFDEKYINNVTIYQLVFMSSGIMDYDDEYI